VAIDGYLFDTNIISILCRSGDRDYAAVRANLQEIRERKIVLPVIALAEIAYGLAKSTGVSTEQAEAFDKFLKQYPRPRLGVDDNTVEPYALLRAQLWRTYGTPKPTGKGHKEKRPEELLARDTGKSLGIDERDLLIAAVAAQYRLVLITHDQGQSMKRIEEAAKALEADAKPIRLRIEYWPK
jgi:predicted nucleic acid-binding protein